MFTNLHSIYSSLVNPSELFGLNIWFFNSLNSWSLLSSELLTFYITSVFGFNSVVTTSFSSYPGVLYALQVGGICLIQVGILLG